MRFHRMCIKKQGLVLGRPVVMHSCRDVVDSSTAIGPSSSRKRPEAQRAVRRRVRAGAWGPGTRNDGPGKKGTRVGESSWFRLLFQLERVGEVEQEQTVRPGHFGHAEADGRVAAVRTIDFSASCSAAKSRYRPNIRAMRNEQAQLQGWGWADLQLLCIGTRVRNPMHGFDRFVDAGSAGI